MDEEQELFSDDDALYHFGVQGMKWGIRSGKGTTGVSRTAGAKIDQNARRIQDIKKQMEPGKSRTVKNIVQHGTLGAAVMHSQWYKKKMKVKISELNAQSERFKSGTATKRDKVNAALLTSPGSKFISVRPK